MKKVLLVLLFVLIFAAGCVGTGYFYVQNKNQIAQNEQLAQQNAQVQAEINAIGQMVEVYEVNKNVYSGNEIKAEDLIAVSVPASTLADSSVQDINQLVGKCYRIDVRPGTILSLDMLMDEDEEIMKMPYDLTLTSLPVSLVTGDYIDIRMVIASGEEYIVLNHKKVTRIYDTTITFNINEEENALLISMMQDAGVYANGCIFYVTKYLEPGNADSIAFYPVQHEMENFVKYNVNIEDPTRCINETLRNHIDEVLLKFTDSDNTSVASQFISIMRTQLQGQLQAQQKWIDEHTTEDGTLVDDNGQVTGTGTTPQGGESLDQQFQQQVGESIGGLEQDIQDLEAIQ